MKNPGKLALCKNKIKFMSQILANTNGTCLISYCGVHTYIQVVMDFAMHGPGKVIEF